MARKTFLLSALILFLALCAIAADKTIGLQPGIPVLAGLPAQRMLVVTAQGDLAKDTSDHPVR